MKFCVKKAVFYCVGSQTLEWVFQKDYGVSVLRHRKHNQMQSSTTCTSRPCFSRAIGQDFKGSLPSWVILWFCDCGKTVVVLFCFVFFFSPDNALCPSPSSVLNDCHLQWLPVLTALQSRLFAVVDFYFYFFFLGCSGRAGGVGGWVSFFLQLFHRSERVFHKREFPQLQPWTQQTKLSLELKMNIKYICFSCWLSVQQSILVSGMHWFQSSSFEVPHFVWLHMLKFLSKYILIKTLF